MVVPLVLKFRLIMLYLLFLILSVPFHGCLLWSGTQRFLVNLKNCCPFVEILKILEITKWFMFCFFVNLGGVTLNRLQDLTLACIQRSSLLVYRGPYVMLKINPGPTSYKLTVLHAILCLWPSMTNF